jgi:general secretion pathway protein J
MNRLESKRLSGPKGFTLLEILIALALFAILSLMAYAGLGSVLDAQASTEPRSEQMAQLQMTLYLLNEDLNQVINRPVRDELGSIEPAFGVGRGNELLAFTRSTPSWTGPDSISNLQRVSYYYEKGALYRQVWTIVDRTPQTQFRRRKLIDAEKVEIKFFSDASDSWMPLTASVKNIPSAIDVSFNLTGLGKIQRLFLIHR